MVTDECPDTPQEQARGANPRLPACDNCRNRKTKCDRGAPCSSCVTAGLSCRITRARPEKRQRILISARYDEALESVDGRLQQLQETVNALHRDIRRAPASTQPCLQQDRGAHQCLSNGWVPRLSAAGGGYRGSPSFEAQAGRIAGSLRDSADPSLLEGPVNGVIMSHASQLVPDSSARFKAHQSQAGTTLLLGQPSNLTSNPEKHSLPPIDPVLNLLRLAQMEKQRFFVDIFVFDEQEFSDLCRSAYFAIDPYTLYTWSIVNVGLFYLFLGLKPSHYADVGVDIDEVDAVTNLLAANAQGAVESFRVCSEPSIEACQALALLGTFCIKSGQIARAWTLISTAARMCTDLGLHQLPGGPTTDRDDIRKLKVFWHLYTMDAGLALTLGRPQSVRLYDVATERPSLGVDVPGIPGKIYAAFFDMTILKGEIQPQLFSAAAEKLPQHIRSQRAREFRARLEQIQTGIIRICDDPAADSPFGEASVLLRLLLHSLTSVVCSAVGPDTHSFISSLKHVHSCVDCTASARDGLELLVKTGAAATVENPKGWARFLNIFLSLAPFTPYIVLVTHAITEYSSVDLPLLTSVKSVLEPVAESSPMALQVLNTCTKLYQLAESAARPSLDDGSAETLLPSPVDFAVGFEPGPLSLHDSTSAEGSGPDTLLEDYHAMLAGLNPDASWKQM